MPKSKIQSLQFMNAISRVFIFYSSIHTELGTCTLKDSFKRISIEYGYGKSVIWLDIAFLCLSQHINKTVSPRCVQLQFVVLR